MRRVRKKGKNNPLQSFYDIDIDSKVKDKLSLWMLRILVHLKGINELIDENNYISDDKIAKHFNLQEKIENKQSVIDYCTAKLDKLEKRKIISTSTILKKNIMKLSNLMDLNKYEKEILEFVIVIEQYSILDDCSNLIGDLSTKQVKQVLSVILKIPICEIDKTFSVHSKFTKSSLITLDKTREYGLRTKLELISDSFADRMLNEDEDIEYMIKDIVSKCSDTELKLNDYNHLNKELPIIISHLKHSSMKNTKGVNILFYGKTGTGKTELAKVIAKELKYDLFEIAYSDNDDEAIEGKKRLNAFKSSQALISSNDTILLFDEIEDVFNNDTNLSRRQQNKAWINRILENNNIPTIWITNNINSIDNAIIRRFDISVEIPIPKKSKRVEILKKLTNNQISMKSILKLSENEKIAPSLISTATNVISNLDLDDKNSAFEMIINNTLKAQGYSEVKDNSSSILPSTYNPNYINSNVDLSNLADGMKESQSARICLYGPSGTGKSAYGHYIANYLDKPVIIKKGSDLLSKYIGETEQNICRAFEEASDNNSVLIFDEVDSFLINRNDAKHSWEITQVNEMLVQMEKFDGIFIATTNLIDNIDKASLRRFDLKMEFTFLKPNQAWELFKNECKELGFKKISPTYKKSLEEIKHLTPGDFSAVRRQQKFSPITDVIDFIQRLSDEIEIKKENSRVRVGFIN